MTHSLPPELLAPEEREARAVELERQIAREWLRFAITEAAVIWLPFAAVGVLFLTETISHTALVALGVVAFLGMSALVLYWVFARIRPLQSEIDAVRSAQR